MPFVACLERWAAEEVVPDMFSPTLGRPAPASRAARFASFPPFLLLYFKCVPSCRPCMPEMLFRFTAVACLWELGFVHPLDFVCPRETNKVLVEVKTHGS